MNMKKLYKLNVDPEFQNLIHPLLENEYEQLEKNIMKYGCIDPIIVWDDVIIDGHNRYQICTKHNIPFSVKKLRFSYREDAISWICEHQLGRRNISEETRKYLIGKQYEAAKISKTRKNPTGNNQYSSPNASRAKKSQNKFSAGHKTAHTIGSQNRIAWNTVTKYAIYARAIEEIREKAPEVVPGILSGQYKISMAGISSIAQLNGEQIRQMISQLDSPQEEYARYKKTRKAIQRVTQQNAVSFAQVPSVKDIPQYDPDADVTALTLTIPTWSGSIKRIRESFEIAAVSPNAREKLSNALFDLQDQISFTLEVMKEN